MMLSQAVQGEPDEVLKNAMLLYNFLSASQQNVVCDFVENFYRDKQVFVHPDTKGIDTLLTVIAANAALVGAAQKTNYFACTKWLYLCSDDLENDGDVYMTSSVRLRSETCLEESENIIPGHNLIVHEFSHILDHLLGISGSTDGLRSGFQKYQKDISMGVQVPIEDTGELFITQGEYFARASEAFFTNSPALKVYDEKLYLDLVSIYGLDLAELNCFQ